jgi:hypothetical protein
MVIFVFFIKDMKEASPSYVNRLKKIVFSFPDFYEFVATTEAV